MFEAERQKVSDVIETLRQVQQAIGLAALEDDSLFSLLPIFTNLVGRETGALVRIDNILKRRGTPASAAYRVYNHSMWRDRVPSQVEQDVTSALTNMQVRRKAAVDAVNKAVCEGVSLEFEPLFRRALEAAQGK